MKTIQLLEGQREAARKALKRRGKFDKMSGDLFANYGYTISSNTLHKIANKTIINPPIGKIGDSKAWLWSQDPRRYTLQLLGGRNDKSIQAFIRKYKLRDKAIYFHTNHNQRNWHALVYGSYNNRSEALQAIKNLPAAIQKTSPWARSFASIHKDLDQSQ